MLFVLAAFVVPPLAFFRFLVLTPIAWFWPRLRDLVEQHASTLVVDVFYLRGDFGPKARRMMLLQEAACWAWCIFVIGGVVRSSKGHCSVSLVALHAYALSVSLIMLNNIGPSERTDGWLKAKN